MNTKPAIIIGTALSLATSIAFAQQPDIIATVNNAVPNSQSTTDNQHNKPQTAISQDEVRRELQQAGFNNIEFLESAYVVRATNNNGTNIVMTITPQEVRALEITPGRPHDNSGTDSNRPGPTAGAQNSGPGISGQAGNKSGPAVSPSGGVSGNEQSEAVRQQDSSNIPGKPGGKSGPTVMPPSGTPK